MSKPTPYVISAIDAGEAFTTRRVELFESDGITPYYPGGDETSRLVDGAVGLDYNRDERRSIDLVLDNDDNALRPDPTSGLWYDKIIKPYLGFRYPTDIEPPTIAIVGSLDETTAYEFKEILLRLGFTRTDVVLGATSYADVVDYEIVVAWKNYSGKLQILLDAVSDGKAAAWFVRGGLADPMGVSHSGTSSSSFEPVPGDTPLIGGWTGEAGDGLDITNTTPTADPGAIVFAKVQGDTSVMGAMQEFPNGGRLVGFRSVSTSTNAKNLYKKIFEWLWNYQPWKTWESQVGEFMIDQINEDDRPHLTRITGRDLTKKCLVSKFEKTISFDSDTPLHTFVQSLGANAGLTKFRLPVTQDTIGSGMAFDRTTERWKAMKDACESNNYELYLDPFGYLSMRKYKDPVTSPYVQTYQTGEEGNLVSWSRSTNDSRLYNHIIVTGESGEEGILPFFGEARNEEPSSPTRIERIGDRSYFYTSSFFTSNQQCEDLALRWLKEKALESYEISWSSIKYPWLDVGEIIEFLDPRRTVVEPTRFLLDSLSIPLGLGPMSSTGKRVTYVNDPSLGG